jgi:parvulin-like peptidyl-prolyl isomerase
MKQHVVSGILCLAMAGCAQSRLAVTKEKEDSIRPNPVALKPVPSVYDTVNLGMGGKAVSQTAMANPDDPLWAGQAKVALVPKAKTPNDLAASTPRGRTDPAPASSAPTVPPATALAQAPPAPPSAPDRAPAAVASARPWGRSADDTDWPPPPRAANEWAPPAVAGLSAAAAARSTPAGPASAQPAAVPADPPIAAVSNLPPIADATPGGAGVNVAGAAGANDGRPGQTGAAAADSPIPLEASSAKPPSAAHERDPLLGPDPDVMPQMTPVPELESSTAARAKSPAGAPATAADPATGKTANTATGKTANTARPPVANPDPKPAGSVAGANSGPGDRLKPPDLAAPVAPGPELPAAPPSLEAAPPVQAAGSPGAKPPAPDISAAPALPELPPAGPAPSPSANPAAPDAAPAPAAPALPPLPGDPDKTTAVSKPAPPGLLAAEVPLEPAPGSSGASAEAAFQLIDGPPLRLPRRDGQVVLASAASPGKDPASEFTVNPNQKAAGRPVARVGDEIITQHDLMMAFRDAIGRYPQLRQESDLDTQEKLAKRQARVMLLRQTLAELIQRSMLAQEAKRLIVKHDPKEYDRFLEIADRAWREEELAPLKRRLNVESDQQIREKLAEQSRSLEAMRQNFIQAGLAEHFLHEKIKDKLTVELPELLQYYNHHIHEFDRPALITWREFVVDTAKYKSRDEARQKAERFLHRLQNGDDFSALAQAESDGPSSSRSRGGLMQTSPGGYAVPAVNAALGTLAIGQLSTILEGPESYHVIKVENRRPPGPASFEEVQDNIRPIIARQKEHEERIAYISKLRKKTVIWTVYEGTPDDPQLLLP